MRHFRIVFLIAIVSMLGFPAAAKSAAGLPIALPATFEGITPCADCPGIRITLTLQADGTYSLQREYLERTAKNAETGKWAYDGTNSRLTLRPGDKSAPEYFSISTAPTLQMLDSHGKPIQSGLNFTLSQVERENAKVSLESTHWALVEIGGKAFSPASDEEAVSLTFGSADKHVSGSSGCNRLMGSYEAIGSKLHFGPIAGTRRMCPPAYMDIEAAFLKALGETISYAISGDVLSLQSADGTVLAKLRAQR